MRPLLAHLTEGPLLPSSHTALSAPRTHRFRGRTPRPARSRGYASPVSLPPPAQASLLAGRAHPSPGGISTRKTTIHSFSQPSRTSIPCDAHRLVALYGLSRLGQQMKRAIDVRKVDGQTPVGRHRRQALPGRAVFLPDPRGTLSRADGDPNPLVGSHDQAPP